MILRSLRRLAAIARANDVRAVRSRLDSPPPVWMIDQIRDDLAPFSCDGIDPALLDQFHATDDRGRSLIRVIVRGNRIRLSDYQHPSGLGGLTKHIRFALHALLHASLCVPLPDADLLFFVGSPQPPWGDGLLPGRATLGNEHPPLRSGTPVFCYGHLGVGPERGVVFPDYASAVPDCCITDSSYRWERIARVIAAENDRVDWTARRPQLFWRGASTDGDYESESWRSLPRARVVQMSRDHPDLIDAQFTALTAQCCATGDCVHHREFGCHTRVSERSQVRFKYLLAMDGNCYTYPGIAWRLLSGSVVLLQETKWRGWFLRGLRPFEHYVPVNRDATDLCERLEWLRTNDHDAQSIARQGSAFVRQHVTLAGAVQYIWLLLEDYAGLQKRRSGLPDGQSRLHHITRRTRAELGFYRRAMQRQPSPKET